jgi:hypothetical protein
MSNLSEAPSLQSQDQASQDESKQERENEHDYDVFIQELQETMLEQYKIEGCGICHKKGGDVFWWSEYSRNAHQACFDLIKDATRPLYDAFQKAQTLSTDYSHLTSKQHTDAVFILSRQIAYRTGSTDTTIHDFIHDTNHGLQEFTTLCRVLAEKWPEYMQSVYPLPNKLSLL